MKNYIPNIPETDQKRIVIIGAGFAGLKLLRKLMGKGFQLVLLDRNNFHQFQPLLYQVATAGLEPSAISFPLRKVLQNGRDVHFRIAALTSVAPEKKEVSTSIGKLRYDHLVLAIGAGTNYFGLENVKKNSMSMKTASDAILIRNTILENFEQALLETDEEKRDAFLNIVIVGGGPTGVELAGALAEMKRYIFPKDYPDMDLTQMRIMLYEMAPRLLLGMSEKAAGNALKYLNKLGVDVKLETGVKDYDGTRLKLSDGSAFSAKTVIWAAGVKANPVQGLDENAFSENGRIKVDRFNRVKGHEDIFALGDLAEMETPEYPDGHPQVAQPAIQQAENLGVNLLKTKKGKPMKAFSYKDKGYLATVGRNLAVADLPGMKLKGFVAWVLWLIVHLFAIVGVKNRMQVFLNWMWNYFTYDQSLRVLIRPKER